MTRDISLCAVPYKVAEQDGQVIFLCNSGFAYCHSEFAYEWKGCGWYLVHTESSWDKIFVPHLVAAYAWIEMHYRIDYVDGTGTAHYQDEIITNPQ